MKSAKNTFFGAILLVVLLLLFVMILFSRFSITSPFFTSPGIEDPGTPELSNGGSEKTDDYLIDLNNAASLDDYDIARTVGNHIEIVKQGKYHICGEASDLSIHVLSGDTVTLELDSVNLSSNGSPAIVSENDGTLNLHFVGERSYISSTSDCAVYAKDKLAVCAENEVSFTGAGEAVIRSCDDCSLAGYLVLNGTGDGINSKKLSIADSSLKIECSGKGIDASSLTISNSDLNISARSDCIESKSTTINDSSLVLSSSAGMGVDCSKSVRISSSKVNINSYDNGLKAKEAIDVKLSVLTIEAICNGIKGEEEFSAESSEISIVSGFDGIQSGNMQSKAGIISLIHCQTVIDSYKKPVDCGEQLIVDGGELLGLGICKRFSLPWNNSPVSCDFYAEGDEGSTAQIILNNDSSSCISHVSKFGFNYVVFSSERITRPGSASLRVYQ